jgi:hypothetical protein
MKSVEKSRTMTMSEAGGALARRSLGEGGRRGLEYV